MQESDEDVRNKDEFVADPAKIRQAQADRQASRDGRSHQQGHTQGQSHKKHDVTGNPKGQGQEKDVTKNRAWKEKNKSTRVHHNRKVLADKKRKF